MQNYQRDMRQGIFFLIVFLWMNEWMDGFTHELVLVVMVTRAIPTAQKGTPTTIFTPLLRIRYATHNYCVTDEKSCTFE